MKKIILLNIHRLMAKRGWSVPDLCEAMGKGKYALNSYFYGDKNFGDITIQAIAEALEVTPEDLMDIPTGGGNMIDKTDWQQKYYELLEKYSALLEGRNRGESKRLEKKKAG